MTQENTLGTASSLSEDDEEEIWKRESEREGLDLFGFIHLERLQDFPKN